MTEAVSSGERNYGPAVDMWGAGCIMAEMWTRSPIMQVGQAEGARMLFEFWTLMVPEVLFCPVCILVI